MWFKREKALTPDQPSLLQFVVLVHLVSEECCIFVTKCSSWFKPKIKPRARLRGLIPLTGESSIQATESSCGRGQLTLSCPDAGWPLHMSVCRCLPEGTEGIPEHWPLAKDTEKTGWKELLLRSYL